MAMDWSSSVATQLIAGAPGSQVVIGSQIPPELTTFYSANYSAIVGGALIQLGDPGSDTYGYFLFALRTNLGPSNIRYFLASGIVVSGSVNEIWIEQAIFSLGSLATLSMFFGPNTPKPLLVDLGIVSVNPTEAFINNVSMPQELLGYFLVTAPANTSAVAGTETVVFTTPVSMTFKDGRAFAVELMNAQIKSAAIQNPSFRLRETNLAGTILVNGPRVPIPVAGIDEPLTAGQLIFINNSGADITQPLVLTMTPQVATLVTLDASTGASAWGFKVRDIGSCVNGVPTYTGVSLV